MKCCLVTICIGEKYLSEYNNLFKPSQEKYAEKCGYDFKVITDYIQKPYDKSLISFNKILVCDYNWDKEYDYIIFVDADIVINKNTPSLHDYYDFGEKIGVVNQSQPITETIIRIEEKIDKLHEITANDYYKLKANLYIETDKILNTGVLVIQPQKHNIFLRNIFNKYYKTQINNQSGFHYEQSVIGFELQKNNMYFIMDMKWNALWSTNKYYYNVMKKVNLTLQEFYNKNYFIHLAGHTDFHLVKIIN